MERVYEGMALKSSGPGLPGKSSALLNEMKWVCDVLWWIWTLELKIFSLETETLGICVLCERIT